MDVRVLGGVPYYFFLDTISRILCYNYDYSCCNQLHKKKIDNEEYWYKYEGDV